MTVLVELYELRKQALWGYVYGTGLGRQAKEKLSLMGTTLVSLRNREEINMAELEWQRGREIRDEVKKVSRGQGQAVTVIGYSEETYIIGYSERLGYLCDISFLHEL